MRRVNILKERGEGGVNILNEMGEGGVNIWKERGEGGVNGHAVMTGWLRPVILHAGLP